MDEPNAAPDTADTDFDGCSRECCKADEHTRVWGRCARSTETGPRLTVYKTFLADDGYMSIGPKSLTLKQLAEQIEAALRTVPVRLGPNALSILERGETVGLSGGEYSSMALAAAKRVIEWEAAP